MANSSTKQRKTIIIYWMVILLIGIVFFFFVGKRGAILEKDSGVFLEDWSILTGYGYIIYPKLLSVFRMIFGESNYLEMVFVFQSLFALCTSIIITEYLRKKCSLSCISSVIIFILSLGPYSYTLPQYVSSHCIITEGIAFPLFNIWMLFAIKYLSERKMRYYAVVLFITIAMLFTRSQLMLFVIIDVFILLVSFFIYCCGRINRKINKNALFAIVAIVAIWLSVVGLLFFVKNNIYPQLTDAVSGRVLCIAEERDYKLFQGMDIELYEALLDKTDELKSNKKYFRIDMKRWEDIVNGTNNNTKMLPDVIREYYPNDEIGEIKGRITFPLLREHIGEYVKMTAILFVQSIVVSVFYHPEWAYTLGFTVGVLLFVGAAILWLYAKKRINNSSISLISLGLTLGVILLICTITNLIFVGLQRYVVYPFGWFYISCFLVIREMYIKRIL